MEFLSNQKDFTVRKMYEMQQSFNIYEFLDSFIIKYQYYY